MKTSEYQTTALTESEMAEINGGIIFILLESLIMGVIVLLPLAAAAYKGWNDYK